MPPPSTVATPWPTPREADSTLGLKLVPPDTTVGRLPITGEVLGVMLGRNERPAAFSDRYPDDDSSSLLTGRSLTTLPIDRRFGVFEATSGDERAPAGAE